MVRRQSMLRLLRISAVLVFSLTFGFGMVGCEDEGGELEIHDINPRSGATTGDQNIRIIGQNFRQDVGYTIYFGPNRASRATLLDTQTLLVSSPQVDEPQSVDVVVISDNGPAFRVTDGFSYVNQGGNVMEQIGGEREGRF